MKISKINQLKEQWDWFFKHPFTFLLGFFIIIGGLDLWISYYVAKNPPVYNYYIPQIIKPSPGTCIQVFNEGTQITITPCDNEKQKSSTKSSM